MLVRGFSLGLRDMVVVCERALTWVWISYMKTNKVQTGLHLSCM